MAVIKKMNSENCRLQLCLDGTMNVNVKPFILHAIQSANSLEVRD
jgi:hypothetical protein